MHKTRYTCDTCEQHDNLGLKGTTYTDKTRKGRSSFFGHKTFTTVSTKKEKL